MRDMATVTPPLAGTAPPLRPVPAPRATTGRSWRRVTFTTSATCWAVDWQDHRLGQAALDGGVVLVDQEVFRGVQDVLLPDDGLELADQLAVGHGGISLARRPDSGRRMPGWGVTHSTPRQGRGMSVDRRASPALLGNALYISRSYNVYA